MTTGGNNSFLLALVKAQQDLQLMILQYNEMLEDILIEEQLTTIEDLVANLPREDLHAMDTSTLAALTLMFLGEMKVRVGNTYQLRT